MVVDSAPRSSWCVVSPKGYKISLCTSNMQFIFHIHGTVDKIDLVLPSGHMHLSRFCIYIFANECQSG